MKPKRPVYLDLLRIRLPITAKVSLLHRISGTLLALVTPLVIYLVDLSLVDAESYERAVVLLQSGLIKVLLVAALWALLHHLLSGIRFLLIDMEVGVDIETARRSAKWVTLGALGATLLLALLLL
ncbi:MAG: succinate dehydrogenase cytochrome b556 subunit [Halothiobacillaceae bacterium]|nr:MAG: succinate dehydrogenase cytochrome b556 subunit [Halothiobacillaceae bacterium]